jgi:pseudo-rSAM protein
LYIEPYVHVNIKCGDVLLYNTLNGEQLVYENSPAIAALLERMMRPENLNVIIEEHTILEEKNLQGFLEAARARQMIHWRDYSSEDGSQKKPVTLPPILNFHRDRKKMALDPERDPGQDIIKYLHKLTIYINCYRDAAYDTPLFNEGYKQFLFPCWAKEYSELNVTAVRQLLDQVKDLGLCNITILGGNIFQHSDWEAMAGLLAQLPLKKNLGVYYKDITAENMERVDWRRLTDTSVRVFVEPQMEKKQLEKCIQLLEKYNIPSTYQFVIQSEADAEALDDPFDWLEPEQLSVNAFYDGGNYNFFKENIFIEQADLSDPVISKKEIYARSVMNPNAFGNLTVLCTGQIHSNLNEKPIGTIDTHLKQILLNELAEGSGWFRLRKDLAPCANCIYHQICPPISNYEYALSQNNLCWRNQDNGSSAHAG